MGSQRPFENSIPIYLHSQVNISNPCFDSLFSNFWHIYSTNFIWVSHNQTYFFFFCRSTGPEDVYVKVICSGICHIDIRLIKNDFGKSNYPMVPGYTLKYTPTCYFPLFKVMSDEWWVISNEWWVTEIKWWKKTNQTRPPDWWLGPLVCYLHEPTQLCELFLVTSYLQILMSLSQSLNGAVCCNIFEISTALTWMLLQSHGALSL